MEETTAVTKSLIPQDRMLPKQCIAAESTDEMHSLRS